MELPAPPVTCANIKFGKSQRVTQLESLFSVGSAAVAEEPALLLFADKTNQQTTPLDLPPLIVAKDSLANEFSLPQRASSSSWSLGALVQKSTSEWHAIQKHSLHKLCCLSASRPYNSSFLFSWTTSDLNCHIVRNRLTWCSFPL